MLNTHNSGGSPRVLPNWVCAKRWGAPRSSTDAQQCGRRRINQGRVVNIPGSAWGREGSSISKWVCEFCSLSEEKWSSLSFLGAAEQSLLTTDIHRVLQAGGLKAAVSQAVLPPEAVEKGLCLVCLGVLFGGVRDHLSLFFASLSDGFSYSVSESPFLIRIPFTLGEVTL